METKLHPVILFSLIRNIQSVLYNINNTLSSNNNVQITSQSSFLTSLASMFLWMTTLLSSISSSTVSEAGL